MKIVITGGHFSPAYTVIKKLKKENDVIVIGRKYAFEGDKNPTLEYELCQKEDIEFVPINAGRLQRKLTKHTLSSLLKFPQGVLESIKILRSLDPDVVLTFGGYIGLSVSIAAKMLDVPVVLHEQTQKAGLSAKIISKFAKCICISFESSRKYFGNRNIIVTGNPIREEIFEFPEMQIDKSKAIIYITGGSTGAHSINMATFRIIEKLLEKYIVVHQTGKNRFNDFENLKEKKRQISNPGNYFIKEFFDPQEVGWLLNNASLVISRAGANTISELIAVKAVALLIPLSHGQSNEQLENAKYFKKSGLGEYIEENENLSNIILNKAFDMIENRKRYSLNDGYKSYSKQSADKIIEHVKFYGRKRENRKNTS